MKALSSFTLLSLLSTALSAAATPAITAAWKCPIDKLVPDLKTAATKLDHAPGESTFLRPGDELWDVAHSLHWQAELLPTSPAQTLGWQGQWVVWDARSQMLIARGAWTDLLAIDRLVTAQRPQPEVRCRFELVQADRTDSLELTAAQEEPNKKDIPARLQASCTAASFDGGHLIDGTVAWPEKARNLTWIFDFATPVTDGGKTLLGRHGSEAAGWQVYVTATERLPDGTPLAEATRVELPGRPGDFPWHMNLQRRHIAILPLDGKRVAAYYPLRQEVRESVLPGLALHEIDAPPELAPWLDGKVIDLGAALANQGDDKPKCYYDPRTSVAILTGRQDLVESAISEISPEFIDPAPEAIWVASTSGFSQWGMLTSYGENGSIGAWEEGLPEKTDNRRVECTAKLIATSTGPIQLDASAFETRSGGGSDSIEGQVFARPGKTIRIGEITRQGSDPIALDLTCTPQPIPQPKD